MPRTIEELLKDAEEVVLYGRIISKPPKPYINLGALNEARKLIAELSAKLREQEKEITRVKGMWYDVAKELSELPTPPKKES